MFNLIIGLVIVYGILMNILIIKFFTPYILALNPILMIVMYFIMCTAGITLYKASDNPITSFFGYNLVVLPIGILLCTCLQQYSTYIIFEAFIMTLLITILMTLISSLYPKVFLSLGKMLFFALLCLIAVEIICLLFGMYPTIISWIAVGIFSLYIAHDWAAAQEVEHTVDNAVDVAANIYIDVVNLFVNLLALLGISDD